MKAMVLPRLTDLAHNDSPLELIDVPIPVPQDWEILVKVSVCGVCHTELDEIEGRTPPVRFPIILGHQIVGRVEQKGRDVDTCHLGDRVGIAWIHQACGTCTFCRRGREKLVQRLQGYRQRPERRLCGIHHGPSRFCLPHSRDLCRW